MRCFVESVDRRQITLCPGRLDDWIDDDLIHPSCALGKADGAEHCAVVTARRDQHKGVPDRVLKSQAVPHVKNDAGGV